MFQAFAPDMGETAAELVGLYPGSTLGPALSAPVPLADGGKDIYIRQDKFRAQFAADLPDADAKLMAGTQRPIAEVWRSTKLPAFASLEVPSFLWFIYGSRDLNIPESALEIHGEACRFD